MTESRKKMTVNMTLNPKVMERLHEYREESGRSISRIVEDAVNEYLDRIEREYCERLEASLNSQSEEFFGRDDSECTKERKMSELHPDILSDDTEDEWLIEMMK